MSAPQLRILSNGLRVALLPDPHIPLVELRLGLLAGSRYEPAALSGLAHLCEHLACQDVAGPRAARTGAVRCDRGLINGRTFHDWVVFSDSLLADGLEAGLRRQAGRLLVDPVDVSPERTRAEGDMVQQERRERLARSNLREIEHLQRLLYPPEHPYSRSPVGLPEGIDAVTADDVAAFLRARYVTDQAVLAVAGDFQVEQAERWIEASLGQLPAGVESDATPCTLPDGGWTTRTDVVAWHVPYVRSYVGLRAPGYGSRGWYVASLLARWWAGGVSSPLHRLLVEDRRLAREVQVYIEPMQASSTIAFVATASAGMPHEKLETALVEALDELASSVLDFETLGQARKRALIHHFGEVQSLSRWADLVACSLALLDELPPLDAQARRRWDLDPRELQSAARELLETRTLLAVVPCRQAA